MIAADRDIGWFKAGSNPSDYDVGTDFTQSFTGRSSGYIRNNKPKPQGFGRACRPRVTEWRPLAI
jgi:hypothetical protein